jgi:hypothetical protein
MKGGFLETLSEWGSSISQGASDLWKKTKDTTSSITSTNPTPTTTTQYSTPSYNATTTSTQSTTTTPMGYGGRRRRTKRRRMRGGFEDNTPVTGLAVNAGPFSGQTAQPNTIVGGRSRRHRRNRRKSRRH